MTKEQITHLQEKTSSMIKLIIGLLFVAYLVYYDGVNTYKDVETLSDLGSPINVYLSAMTAIVLIAFGVDEIIRDK